MASRPAFLTENLKAGFGDRRVLEGVTLAVPTGCVTTVTGPGGSGKSTLLRLLAASEFPPLWTEGHVRRADPVSLLPQKTPARTRILDCVASPGQCERAREFWACAPRAADELLDPKAPVTPARLRLAAFTSACLDPAPVLLLDEPETGVGDRGREWIIERLAQLRAAGGRTIVLVTHNLALVRAASDRIVLLIDGQIVEEGEAAALFEKPRHPRTQHFLTMGC